MSHIPAIIFFLICSLFVVTISYSQENTLKQSGKQEPVLSQADQLILEAINKTNGRIDNLSKELNGRIDTLWITMLGGFMGVMAFIGGIVFWDRRTFLKRAREECRQAITEDRKMLEGMLAAIKKLSEKFPEVRQVLNNFGL